eukprot:IDg16150t1
MDEIPQIYEKIVVEDGARNEQKSVSVYLSVRRSQCGQEVFCTSSKRLFRHSADIAHIRDTNSNFRVTRLRCLEDSNARATGRLDLFAGMTLVD